MTFWEVLSHPLKTLSRKPGREELAYLYFPWVQGDKSYLDKEKNVRSKGHTIGKDGGVS